MDVFHDVHDELFKIRQNQVDAYERQEKKIENLKKAAQDIILCKDEIREIYPKQRKHSD